MSLSEDQQMAFGTILEQLVLVAGHPIGVAQAKASRVFQLMYERAATGWHAREHIPLGHHGSITVRNKFYKREQVKRTGDRT